MKKLITLILASLIIFSAVSCGKNNNEESKSNNESVDGTAKIPYTLIISCDEILANMDNETYGIKADKKDIVPKDGMILKVESECTSEDNAFDVVAEMLRSKKIHYEGTDGYFKGIANLYEGDCGQYSGWMFFVNGNLSETGASHTPIEENDIIEFKYVVDYNTLFN